MTRFYRRTCDKTRSAEKWDVFPTAFGRKFRFSGNRVTQVGSRYVGQTENACLAVSSFFFIRTGVLPHGSRSIRMMNGFSAIDGVKGQLKSIRSSYFIEDPEQIVPHGVLTELQFLG